MLTGNKIYNLILIFGTPLTPVSFDIKIKINTNSNKFDFFGSHLGIHKFTTKKKQKTSF